MSNVEELQERVSSIQAELADAESKLASWQSKKQAALSEFEAALDEGDEAPHEESSVVSECRFACNHFQSRIAELKQAQKRAKAALMQERYNAGVVEIRQARVEAAQRIEEVEDELLSTIKELYDQAWTAQEGANNEINRFNSRIVTAVGQKGERTVKKMSGLREDAWVEAVMRQALRSGNL